MHFVLPSGLGSGTSKENVDEGSDGANAKEEKTFAGLWNPCSREFNHQFAARFTGSNIRLRLVWGRCGVSPLK